MNSQLRDLKFSTHALLKHPGFAAAAVLALALGIAANTTIFSTVDALILHPFSFSTQRELLALWEQNLAAGDKRGPVPPPNFVAVSGKTDAGPTLLRKESKPRRDEVAVRKPGFRQQQRSGDQQIARNIIAPDPKVFIVAGVDREARRNRERYYLRVITRAQTSVMLAEKQVEMRALAKRAQQQFLESTGPRVSVEILTDEAAEEAGDSSERGCSAGQWQPGAVRDEGRSRSPR